MSKKKTSDIGMFIIGWISSALAIVIPIIILILIKKYLPDEYASYGDKITILAYLVGAFFSGLYASYRVSCKSDEKDQTIRELESQIEGAKKSYNALSPKSKIIGLLHELHTASHSLSKPAIQKLIMKKIGEINDDSSFDPRYDGMISQIGDSQYKATGTSEERQDSASDTESKGILESLKSIVSFKPHDEQRT